nr:ParB/RepB/Spo0J family partition protein [Brevibacterium zhoupengii]
MIPDAASSDRPVDVFFSGGDSDEAKQGSEEQKAPRTARTDPAASMQSSRRRKPKAASSTTSSTAKTAETDSSTGKSSSAKSASTPKSSTSKSTPAKRTSAKAASTSSTNTKKSAPSAKAPSTSAASSTTSKRSTTGSKTSRSKTADGKATRTAAKTTSAGTEASTSSVPTSSVKTPSDVKISRTKEAASTASSPEVDSVPATSRVETSQGQEYDTSYEAVAPSFETAEPDVEASSGAVTDEGSESETSSLDDEVSENHPGVYRSGHETFDEARTEQSAIGEQTTDEVDPSSEITSESDGYSPVEESSEGASEAGSSDEGVSASGDESGIESSGVDSIPDTEFGEINVDLIDANPRQPRTFFDEDQLSELVHSIREIGVLQPVVVRQKPGNSERFELIMGERRLRATKDAGLSAIPAIIRYVDDTDLLRDALLENLHRAELNPLEEAAAYGQLLEDFGCTQEELSERIGRSRPQISNTLRLLRLPPLVQRRVAAGVISAGHARAILGLREPEHMEILAQRIVAEGLSVRASEEAVVLLNRGDSMNVSRATTKVAPQFIEVAERLGDRLDTKVNITVGKKKGKLSVEFANQDDLDRILLLLGVESPNE